jgi:hypothetical protein
MDPDTTSDALAVAPTAMTTFGSPDIGSMKKLLGGTDAAAAAPASVAPNIRAPVKAAPNILIFILFHLYC